MAFTGMKIRKSNKDAVREIPSNLPLSCFLSDESKNALHTYAMEQSKYLESIEDYKFVNNKDSIIKNSFVRERYASVFYSSKIYQNLINLYPVNVKREVMDEIPVETFTPNIGVSKINMERVLINLHGGGFMHGARTVSHLESIPISKIGRIKVVSVDYRMAPEHHYPSANYDVLSVYKTLLQRYEPNNIGIFGCSAGALLTSQTIAYLRQEGLPMPGAITLSCGGAFYWSEGDTANIIASINNQKVKSIEEDLYFQGMDEEDKLAFPGKSQEILRTFPPTLLISSTQDTDLSVAAYTHRQLVNLGIKSDLQIWEGLGHAFLYNFYLPESNEAYEVITRFFDSNLNN